MEGKTPREIQALLAKPFAPEDIEWRIQTALEEQLRGVAIPYVTNRAIQSRLDDVVGPENWHNEFKPWHSAGKKDAQICGISIYFEGRGWIQKWDGAEDSDIEPIKGGLSDSMKRAAVQWGIGRTLYSMDMVWVNIEKRGRSLFIKDSERPRLDSAYLDMLKKLGLTHAGPVGTQAQLVPKDNPAPAAPAAPAAQPPADPKPQRQTAPPTSQAEEPRPREQQNRQSKMQPPSRVPERAKIPEPQYEYTVTDVKVQSGMSGKSTSLELADRDGKKVRIFAKGEPAGLAYGVRLDKVRFSVIKQNTVVFNVLESYEIVNGPVRQAA